LLIRFEGRYLPEGKREGGGRREEGGGELKSECSLIYLGAA
jgi:hypothetical protein